MENEQLINYKSSTEGKRNDIRDGKVLMTMRGWRNLGNFHAKSLHCEIFLPCNRFLGRQRFGVAKMGSFYLTSSADIQIIPLTRKNFFFSNSCSLLDDSGASFCVKFFRSLINIMCSKSFTLFSASSLLYKSLRSKFMR